MLYRFFLFSRKGNFYTFGVIKTLLMKSFASLIVFLFFIYWNIYAQKSKTNFIIFIADDVSYDDFGCTGNPDVKTPNIDKLAANGIKFTNAYLTASSCSPSRNSILTGRYPHNTELHTQPPLWMPSFPEILNSNGYFCGFAGKFHSHDFAEEDFDIVSREYEEIGNSGSDSWVSTLNSREKDQPFFIWFAALDAHRAWGENQFSGTHHPDSIKVPFYLADAPGTRKDLAQYYDEIYRFDYRIGEVMDELEEQGVMENTCVIIMADNGRPFPHSKTRVNDRGMKTPFIVYWPEKLPAEPQVSNSLISAVDIAPTIVSLAGYEVSPTFQGRSFGKILDDPSQPFRNYVFAEHNWHDYEAHERMVRDKNFMYILNSRPLSPNMGPADALESPSHRDLIALKAKGELSVIQADIFVTPRPAEELYDCRFDPLQLINVAAMPQYQDQLEHLSGVLQQWMKETGDNVPHNLTKDWFLRLPGYINTTQNGVRGELPGEALNATKINEKGPF